MYGTAIRTTSGTLGLDNLETAKFVKSILISGQTGVVSVPEYSDINGTIILTDDPNTELYFAPTIQWDETQKKLSWNFEAGNVHTAKVIFLSKDGKAESQNYGVYFANSSGRTVLSNDNLPYVKKSITTVTSSGSDNGIHFFENVATTGSELHFFKPRSGQWICPRTAFGYTQLGGAVRPTMSSNQNAIDIVTTVLSDEEGTQRPDYGMAIWNNGGSLAWHSDMEALDVTEDFTHTLSPTGPDWLSWPISGNMICLSGISADLYFGSVHERNVSIEYYSSNQVKISYRTVVDDGGAYGPSAYYSGLIYCIAGMIV